MKILLTGSNGLIGRKIIQYVSSIPDIDLVATSTGNARFIYPGKLIYEPFDITDDSRGKKLFDQYKPDAVINCAAITQADDCEINEDKCKKVNIEAVEKLVDLSIKHDSFFLQLSTDFVFNGKQGPYSENDQPDPVSKYGLSKLESEKRVLESGVNGAVVRTILVYGYTGSASRNNLVTWVIKSLSKHEGIKVVFDQIRTPTLAEDVAKACFVIAKNKHTGIFHIGGKDRLSPYEMAVKTARFFRLDESLIQRVPTSTFPQPAKRPMITGLIIEKARSVFGYDPQSFEEGLEIVRKQIADDQ
jgi:dTDP-4-dehydrorhamnose reductase